MKDTICFGNNKNIIFHADFCEDVFKLPSKEVHLWVATIDDVPECPISADEARALKSIKFPLAARRFESTRKLLRYLFRAYLRSSEYQINKTDAGKPFLLEFPEFHFNVTHSKKMIVVALSQAPLGVDLESVRKLDVVRISKRFFAAKELLFFQERDHNKNRDIFFKLWTAKEAAVKADGRGIAIGMKENSAVMDKEQVVSIFLRKQAWHITSWRLEEEEDCFFGAIATPFVPTVIHWYDLRKLDKICD